MATRTTVEIDGTTYDVANLDETSYHRPGQRYPSKGGLFALWFGAHGSTRVLAWARSFEDALENAAGYCSDMGWKGLFTEWDDTDRAEALKEAGGDEERAQEILETDHTYTESGWIPSWEWGGSDASAEQIAAVVALFQSQCEHDADDDDTVCRECGTALEPIAVSAE